MGEPARSIELAPELDLEIAPTMQCGVHRDLGEQGSFAVHPVSIIFERYDARGEIEARAQLGFADRLRKDIVGSRLERESGSLARIVVDHENHVRIVRGRADVATQSRRIEIG